MHAIRPTRRISLIRIAVVLRIRAGSHAHTDRNVETVLIRINHLGLGGLPNRRGTTYLDTSRMGLCFHLLPKAHFQRTMTGMENDRKQHSFLPEWN